MPPSRAAQQCLEGYALDRGCFFVITHKWAHCIRGQKYCQEVRLKHKSLREKAEAFMLFWYKRKVYLFPRSSETRLIHRAAASLPPSPKARPKASASITTRPVKMI